MSPEHAAPHWGLVIPVKPSGVAKSRLAVLGDRTRRDLAASFAADTVTAALGCALVDLVLVVTDDHVVAAALRELGADVLPDGASDDLNASLGQAAAELHRRRPDLRVAAVCADLPALRSEELGRVLAAAPADRPSFLADADGTGTTAYLSPGIEGFRPRFGAGSRAAHLEAGTFELTLTTAPSVRRDVDTPEDLEDARGLGVGMRTSLVLTGLRL